MMVMNGQEVEISSREITITPEAAKQIRNIRSENQIPDSYGLRIGVQSAGCCGPSYVLAFDDKIGTTDRIFQSEGIPIYVDEENLEGLSGATLEYIDDIDGKGFKFNNPNQSRTCNCDDNSRVEKSCGCGDH
jgi:iron-sulfur cluster assembly protein